MPSSLKISVFTPSHETSWLPRIYDCLKSQTYANWEWVIVYNNGAVPLDFADDRVKAVHLEYPTNQWVGPLKRIACDKSTGEILVELDHDDLLTDDALQEIAAAFEDGEVGFVYSNTITCDGNLEKQMPYDGAFGWRYRAATWNGRVYDETIHFPPNPDAITRIWFAPNHVRAFRASVYRSIGGYRKDMRVLDDLDLMCRMYVATKFKHIDKPLYIYRVHGENTWLRHNQEIQENVLRIHDEFIEPVACAWAKRSGLRSLDLGGRFHAIPGFESVDIKDADVVCDLRKPWPFADSSVGVIRAMDVLEHLPDPMFSMKEISRVLAPGGWLICQVPSTDGRGAFQDPTHCSFWNENSFHYYTKSVRAVYIDTPVRFQAVRLETTQPNDERVSWVRAHLVNLKDGYRPPGLIEI